MERPDIDNMSSNLDTADFVHLLTVNQRKLYSYIFRMVGNYHDANDIMQETTSVMWKKIASFETGTNFLGWAIRIAHYNILNHRKRNKCMLFDNELFEALHIKSAENIERQDQDLEYLQECLESIKETDMNLVTMRYMKDLPVKEIANITNRTTQSLYRTLGRIHEILIRCIRHKRAIDKI